mmetsp:Transcript_7127/g.9868  ORF Transcript_7127/g.9868 Transcript_7127/m.9868 type:complete len:518 (+) Transcript_7127:32-1585(+)
MANNNAAEDDSVFGELEDQCTCWVCFEIFKEPVTLHCSHSFCQECASKVYKKNPTCPFCRKPFELPLPPVNQELEQLVARFHRLQQEALNAVNEENMGSLQESWLLNLPEEVIIDILKFVPPKQIGKCTRLCKDFSRITNDPWLWRELCQDTFPFCSVDKYGKNWKWAFIARSNIHKGWEGGKAGDFSVTTMRGHTNYVNAFRLYRNNIVSGSADSTLKIWKTDSDTPIHTLVGHNNIVNSVEFNEVKIVSGSSDNTVKVWDTRTGVPIKTLSHNGAVNSVQFDDSIVASGSSDQTIRVFDLRDGSSKATLQHNSMVRKISFNSSNVVALTANSLKVWDTKTNNPITEISDWNNPPTCFMVNKNQIVAGFTDGSVKCFDMTSGQATQFTGPKHVQAVTDIKCDANTIVSACVDGTLKVWDLPRHKLLHTLDEHKQAVHTLQFGNNKVVSGSADNSLKVWDLTKGARLYSLLGGSLQKRANNPEHPTKPGCSQLEFDDSRIVASFDFEHYKPPTSMQQ